MKRELADKDHLDKIDFAERIPPNATFDWFNTPNRLKLWWYQLSGDWQEFFLADNSIDEENEYSIKSFGLDQIAELLFYVEGLYIDDWFNRGKIKIHSLSALTYMTNLKDLELTTGAIKDISALKNLPNLENVDLAANEINNLNVFASHLKLRTLNLCNNKLSNFSSINKLHQLVSLNLSFNDIFCISDLGELANLIVLNLRHNTVDDITILKSLVKLENLNLSSNKIKDISVLKYLEHLEYLDLSYNPIDDLTVLSNLISLKVLDIQGCFLEGKQIALLQSKIPNCRINSDFSNKQIEDYIILQNSFKELSNKCLPCGKHIVSIDSVIEYSRKALSTDPWIDPDQMIKFNFTNELGNAYLLLSLIGYTTMDDYNLDKIPSHVQFVVSSDGIPYAINKVTSCRIENILLTENRYKILQIIARHCGINESVDLVAEVFTGNKIGVVLTEPGRVSKTFRPEEI